MLALKLLRCLERPRNDRSVGNHGEIRSRLHNFRLTERDHVIRPWIGRASVSLTIKPLVLQKKHRIVAPNRGAQKSCRIERVRREDDAHSRSVGEYALTALRVIN